jgi:hypothetical protein
MKSAKFSCYVQKQKVVFWDGRSINLDNIINEHIRTKLGTINLMNAIQAAHLETISMGSFSKQTLHCVPEEICSLESTSRSRQYQLWLPWNGVSSPIHQEREVNGRRITCDHSPIFSKRQDTVLLVVLLCYVVKWSVSWQRVTNAAFVKYKSQQILGIFTPLYIAIPLSYQQKFILITEKITKINYLLIKRTCEFTYS